MSIILYFTSKSVIIVFTLQNGRVLFYENSRQHSYVYNKYILKRNTKCRKKYDIIILLKKYDVKSEENYYD